jgi:hypothetical protein
MAHRLHLDYGEGRRLFDAEGRCIAQVQRVGLMLGKTQGTQGVGDMSPSTLQASHMILCNSYVLCMIYIYNYIIYI